MAIKMVASIFIILACSSCIKQYPTAGTKGTFSVFYAPEQSSIQIQKSEIIAEVEVISKVMEIITEKVTPAHNNSTIAVITVRLPPGSQDGMNETLYSVRVFDYLVNRSGQDKQKIIIRHFMHQVAVCDSGYLMIIHLKPDITVEMH